MRGGAFSPSPVYIAMFLGSHRGQNEYLHCSLYPFLDGENAVYVLNVCKHQCRHFPVKSAIASSPPKQHTGQSYLY